MSIIEQYVATAWGDETTPARREAVTALGVRADSMIERIDRALATNERVIGEIR